MIVVYTAEKSLAEQIRDNRISYASAALLDKPFPSKVIPRPDKAKAENPDQPDLFYLKTILVSTGWNKNDDVFDRAEVWAARETPEDKPFNFEHDSSDIIGHITGCYPVNDKHDRLDPSILLDELPDPYHLATSAVLYRYWDSQDLQERMDGILTELAKGNWFVSMEAIFRGFDYAVVKPDGVQAIVARNEQSAFLTKHLRAYGGDGSYDGYKVGRLLRNITFSGKGLVRKPANPNSVIFSTAVFKPTPTPYLVYAPKDTQEISMANEHEDRIKVLEAELKEAQKTIRDLDGKAVTAKVGALEEHIKELKAENKALEEKVDAAEKAKKASEKVLSDLKKSFDEVKTELDEVKAAKVHAERIQAVKAKLGVDQKDAEQLVKKFAKLDDEAFAAAVEVMEKSKAKKSPVKTVPVKGRKSVKGPKGYVTAGDEDEDDNEDEADTDIFDEAEEEDEATLATAGDEERVEKVRADIQNYLGRKKGAR